MARLKRALSWLWHRRGVGTPRNKWGADLPSVPAGTLFDERVPERLAERIDRLLDEAHGNQS